VSRAGRVVRTTTGVVGELLITAGVLLLLFVVWQLWWTDVQADAAQREVTDQLQQDWGTGEETPPPAADVPPPPEPEPTGDGPFAVVHVPRFGEGWQPRPVYEGTGLDLLEDGVGHYPGTALPGAVGNLALAGHRVTYGKPFNQVEELRTGDAVLVETAQAWYTYRVTSTQVVRPDQVEVIAAVPGDETAVPTERVLTLTTCHPMFSARERFVVHAVLDEWQPRSSGEPTALAAGAGA
jgi:sortase A